MIGFISTLEHDILVSRQEKAKFSDSEESKVLASKLFEFCLLKMCRDLGCFCDVILLLYDYSINGIDRHSSMGYFVGPVYRKNLAIVSNYA